MGSVIKRMLLVVVATLLGSVSCFVVGAFLGGNYATHFEFFHFHGYEATGVLGLLLGAIGGAALALYLTRARRA